MAAVHPGGGLPLHGCGPLPVAAAAATAGGCSSDAASNNALEQWCKIEPLLSGKQVILFLDYDGTLSPIVDQPEKAYMRDSMRPVLAAAAQHFTTAIVTGRSKEKVYDFVRLDGVFYAGSHGFEIQGPRAMPVNWQVANSIRPTLERSASALNSRLAHVGGCEIEDNKFSMSVHYRKVDPTRVEEVHAIVHDYVRGCPDVALKHGKKVLELRPNVPWNKGSAVLWILEALGLDKRDDVFPLYLGDDITDEDAFQALQSRSSRAQREREIATHSAMPIAGKAVADPRPGSLNLLPAAAMPASLPQAAAAASADGSGATADDVPDSGGFGCGGIGGNGAVGTGCDCQAVAMGGLGILVKEEHDPERPKETSAQFSLRNPAEVESFLQILVARMSPHQQQQPGGGNGFGEPSSFGLPVRETTAVTAGAAAASAAEEASVAGAAAPLQPTGATAAGQPAAPTEDPMAS